MKLIALSIVVITSTAVLAAAHDTPAHFRGMAQIWKNGDQAIHAAATSEDLPDPKFTNRWRLLVCTEALDAAGPHGAWITAASVGGGRMLVAIWGWGAMVVTPSDADVRKWTALAAAKSETRWQTYTIRPLGDGNVEILMEEPKR